MELECRVVRRNGEVFYIENIMSLFEQSGKA